MSFVCLLVFNLRMSQILGLGTTDFQLQKELQPHRPAIGHCPYVVHRDDFCGLMQAI